MELHVTMNESPENTARQNTIMRIISDLQIHSKYSRAVSQEMIIPKIWDWAKRKGIGLVATGDWTHPLWMREIKGTCEETGTGLLKLKGKNIGEGPLFLLATEVSSIYSQGGKLRRIHTLIWVSSISSADKINAELTRRGANLISDGRPIIGLSSIEVAELVFTIDPKALVIPAHAWTPWFSLYGSESGFDSITECFGKFSKYIFAIETGLSSNPAMNWRVGELDNRSVVSFSDAHSGPKLGREATVFEMDEPSFTNIREALLVPIRTVIAKKENRKFAPTSRIAYTLEFYPEEGKYHYTGHRNCGIKQSPLETKAKGTICPVCGRKLTIGVMHRVEQLAVRSEADLQLTKKQLPDLPLQGTYSGLFPERPPYIMLVPLQEILSEVIGGLPTSVNVQNEFRKLTDYFQSEFTVLLETPAEKIAKISGIKVAEAIERVRKGTIMVDPGFDGVFGVVKIWEEKNKDEEKEKKDQLSLF